MLDAWLKRLETQHPKAMDLGLDRLREVWLALGAPWPGAQVVTVAGTNGKGSAVATLRALALAHGLRVGDTTSPHLHRFNERIQVQGTPASDAQIVAAFERIEAARGELTLTYFETAILAALLIMADAAVDLAILEVGLGGRLDAVNIIDADLALLTPVDLDHQSWLGTTREAIGREKAGVFRAGRPVIIADPDPPTSVLERVAHLGCPSARFGLDFGLRPRANGQEAFITGFEQHLAWPLKAPLPVAPPSFLGALQAWAALGYPLTGAVLDGALAMAPPPGRQQWRAHEGQMLLLDVAHNPHAAAFLAERLETPLDLAVFGCYADKDAEGMFRALAPRVRRWLFVPTPGPRGQAGETLAARLAPLCEAAGQPFEVLPSLSAEGLQGALAASRNQGLKRVGFLGSFSVASLAETALVPNRSGDRS